MIRQYQMFAMTALTLGAWTSCDRFPNRVSISHGDLEHSFTRSFISRIGDKDIEFGLTDKDISQAPAWSPSQAPPIAFQEVVTIAEKELPKYTHGTPGWYVQGIGIEQIRRSSDGRDKWIYLVHFGGIGDGDYFQIPVSLQGVPIQGKERPHDNTRD